MRIPGHDHAHRRGATLVGLLLWLLALSLFVAPFLASRAAPDPEGDGSARSELDEPFDVRVARFEKTHGGELGSAIELASEEWFALDAATWRESGLIDASRARAGKRAYETHCVGCHGATGNGAGPASALLHPRPRNFRRGVFKFTSTASGERPLPSDLFRTITSGLWGSSMPDFRLVNGEIRWDLVEYVRYLAIRGEFEELSVDLAFDDEEVPDLEEAADIVLSRWDRGALHPAFPSAPETPYDDASVARGRELYLDSSKSNCAACHGETGVGDGPSATAFDDGWGYPIAPRDLTTGVLRAGDAPEDIYRSIATGINGTPMPAFAASLTPEQTWDLVHFVQSLSRR